MVTLIELSIAKFCKKDSSKYKEYLSLEYPRLGEMYSYNGYLDYLRLSQTSEQELMLIHAKSDFIAENYVLEPDDTPVNDFQSWLIKEMVSENWRPRKMWRDSTFISEINTESIVFPEDIDGLTDLLEFKTFENIVELIQLYFKILGLD